MHWDTQVERGQRNWLADYEVYLISQAIYPPWKATEAPPEGEPPFGYTPEQIAEYEAYLAFLKEYPDMGLPAPKDIDDYFANKDEWQDDYVPPEPAPPEPTPPEEPGREYTEEEKREYYTYRNYASVYGDPNDWYPLNIEDYFKNWDTAQEQLGEWQSEELKSTTEQEQYEREREEAEAWALSPEEAARRREESYEYSQWAKERSEYAAQEAYHETPEYGQSFSDWFGSTASKSQPLQSFIKGMFGELKTEYQAGLPTLTGFPTREEARAEAERRETGFERWLPKQMQGLKQQFWAQAPWQREERPGTFAPRVRSVAF